MSVSEAGRARWTQRYREVPEHEIQRRFRSAPTVSQSCLNGKRGVSTPRASSNQTLLRFETDEAQSKGDEDRTMTNHHALANAHSLVEGPLIRPCIARRPVKAGSCSCDQHLSPSAMVA